MKILNTEQIGSIKTEVSNHVYVKKHLKLLDDFKTNANNIQKGIVEKVDFSNPTKTAKHINRRITGR